MDYTLFFEKNDQLSYALLQLFSVSSNQIITQDKILDTIAVSEYKLTQILESLNNDLAAISSTTDSCISAIDNRVYQGKSITTTAVHEIRLMYLERSTLFALFSYNLLTANRESKEAFRKNNFVSKTKFYAGQLEIRDILNNSDFYKSPSLVKSTEYVTRLRIFEFFYTAYNGIGKLYPEMDTKVNNLIINLQSQFNFAVKPVQKNKLEIFIKIWLLRFMNNCPMKDTIIPSKNLSHDIQQRLKNIGTSIKNAFNVKLPDEELNFLYTFLVTQLYLPNIQEVLDKEHFELAYSLTDQLMNSVLSTNVLVQTENINTQKLQDSLNAIHLQFTTFYVEPTTFISFDSVRFFKETYPIFHTIVNQFIQHLTKVNMLVLTQHEAANLYFDYMFSLINCIPKELLHDKVYICVDFSQGEHYTEYIIKTLQGFNNANLIITTSLSAQTDIYLSDFYSSSIRQQQMIWRNPPTPEDWAILGDTIIEIKQRKVQSLVSNIEREAT